MNIVNIRYPKDVREIVLNENGVLNGLKKGGIYIDMTTSEPCLAEEIYNISKSKGINSLDAPGNIYNIDDNNSIWRRYWCS